MDQIHKREALDAGEGDIVLGDLSNDAVELALVVSIGCNDCSIAIRHAERILSAMNGGVRIRLRLFAKKFKFYYELTDDILSASIEGRHEDAFARLLEKTKRSLHLTPELSIPANPADYSTALQAQLQWYNDQGLKHIPVIAFQGYIYAGVRVEDLQSLIQNAAAQVRAARRKAAA